MKLVFVDSSAWIAVCVEVDKYHQIAKKYYSELIYQNAMFITSNYVLSETYTRIRYDVSYSKAIKTHQIISEAINKKKLNIVWIDKKIDDAAWDIFKKYSEQTLSIVDCTTIAIVKKLKIDEIFAFDDDFLKVGLNVQPKI